MPKTSPSKVRAKTTLRKVPSLPSSLTPEKTRLLRSALVAWYAQTKRDLPWRKTRDPYAIWLSEVMLQQTRVDTVVPYYQRFLRDFPSVGVLAEAPLDKVLTLWSGLGYYRRARMLHATAKQVVSDHDGQFPNTVEGLRSLHGVGAYTAGAVASIAFGRSAALVDGNVARVLARVFGVEDDVRAPSGLAQIWATAEALVPESDAGEWNQALMELGATVCAPRDPECFLCPVNKQCVAYDRGQERELPRVKPKNKPVLRARVALVAHDEASVLLAQRKVDGTFGGMWEPPSVDSLPDVEAKEMLARTVEIASAQLSLLGNVVHVLSHRRMQVAVYAFPLARVPLPAALHGWKNLGEYAAFEVVPIAELNGRALTTFARKVLAKASIV